MNKSDALESAVRLLETYAEERMPADVVVSMDARGVTLVSVTYVVRGVTVTRKRVFTRRKGVKRIE